MKKDKDADMSSDFSEDDLLNFSPNENGELFIEKSTSTQSEKQSVSSSVEVPQPQPIVEEERSAVHVEVKEDETEENLVDSASASDEEVSEQQYDDEDSSVISEKEDEYNQNDEEMEKKRAKGLIICLLVLILLLLLLLGGCIWMYFSKIKPKIDAPKEEVTLLDTIPEPEPVKDTVPVVEEVVDTIPEVVEVDTVEPEPKAYYPVKRIAGKNKVPTTGWLIGYRATPDEAEAIKTVAELSYVDSIPCGYYWINDAREGKKLFKVYIGPYNTQAEVESVFPMIKGRVADAHIYSEDPAIIELYRQQKQVYTAEVVEE